jgi:tRNA pseudouridine38-40 synthase
MLLVLHYDGGAFAGWQRQKAARTVQADLEASLGRLIARPVTVLGSGRTDAGVHALGQAAAAPVPEQWGAAELARALNAVLPPDIWVASACRMRAGFNPRRHATERTYCYRIGLEPAAHSPFRRRWEWAVPRLDLAELQRAAALLAGEHSFRALSAAGQEKAHYRCHIAESAWQAREDAAGLEYWITADRFLHRMVRFCVGMMIEIARGRRSLTDLRALLAAVDNRAAAPPAPPHGLFLVNVSYPGQWYAD